MDKVALKKKMRIGDTMEFSSGDSFTLSYNNAQKTTLKDGVSVEILEKYSKNWYSVLFKIPIEIKFKFLKGERNAKSA